MKLSDVTIQLNLAGRSKLYKFNQEIDALPPGRKEIEQNRRLTEALQMIDTHVRLEIGLDPKDNT